jgi:hypothetical protein
MDPRGQPFADRQAGPLGPPPDNRDFAAGAEPARPRSLPMEPVYNGKTLRLERFGAKPAAPPPRPERP